MKRILRTAAGIYLLLAFALLLTGCISIEMKVKNNGSCDLKYEIKTEGMVGLAEVKKQLQSSIDEANESAGKDVAKLKNVKEKDGTITANISISNVAFLDDEAFFGKYSDFKKEYPDKLVNIWEAKSGEPVNADDIKGAGRLNVVMVAGMESGGGDLTEFNIILPGDVKYMSSNVWMIDSKTVSMDGGYGFVMYQRGGAGWLLYVLIIAIIVVAVIVIIGKKKQNKSSAATAATPTAPAAPMVAATTPAADNATVIHCPHCNSEQKSSAVFCSACGGKISQ